MSKVCIQCGVELEEGAAFCDECGAKQQQEQTIQEKQQVRQSSVSNGNGQNVQGEMPLKNSGMGIASFVIGIISICTLGCFIIPEILGVIFGIVAVTEKNTKHSLAIAGLAMSIISIVLLALIFIIG